MKKELIDYDDIDFLKIEKEKKDKPKKQPVDKQKLYEEFVKYKKMCVEAEKNNMPRPRLTEEIGKAIIKITQMTTYINTNTLSFLKYTNNWKEEMVGDAIEICNRYVHNFDPEKSKNPFSYIQQLVINSFLQRIEKERTQLYYRYKLYENANGFAAELDLSSGTEDDFKNIISEKDLTELQTEYASETSSLFIKSFEERKKIKRDKYKDKKEINSKISIDDILSQ